MTTLVLTDASITINAVDLSAFANSVNITFNPDMVDFTAFSHDTKGSRAGLKDWSISIDFFQDFAAASVDATIWALINGGTEFTFLIRPTSAAVSATNPNYTSTGGLIDNYTPFGNSIGEAAKATISIKPGVNAALTRATS